MTSLVSHDEKATTAAAFSSSTTDDPQQQLLQQQQQRSHKVRVAVRVRPMNTKESSSSEVRQIVKVPPPSSPMANSVVVDGATPEQLANRRLTKSIVHGAQQFDGFYKVFSPHAQQEDVFEDTAREIIEDAFRGLNGSLMAYGSTGSGKTHSTFGSELSSPGIIPRAAALIFKRKQELENFEGKYVTVKLYFLEVYQESCRDLLNAANICQLRDKVIGGVGPNGTACEVAGVKYVYPTSASQMLNIIDQGFTQRVSHETHANQHSSRSHAILSIEIEVRETPEASSGLLGKLKFCDLAGSERAAATKNDGLRFREGANINKSLLALGNVIQALAKPNALQNFIPYRGSKLTRLLRESLGGNCTSILLVCIAPSSLSAEETLNTMHYATLAKKISTQVRVNTVEVSPEALKEQYELALSKKDQEIDALKEELRKLYAERISLGITGGGGGGAAAGGENENEEDEEAADDNENENDGNLLHFHSDGTQEGGDTNTTSPLAKHPAERGSATFSPGSTGRLSSASKEPVHKNLHNNNFNSGELFSTSLSPDRMMNIATSRLKALSKKNSREIGVQTAPSPQNFMMQFNASSTSPYPTPIFNFGSNDENADLDVSEDNSNQHNMNSDTSLDSPFAQNNNSIGNANRSKPNSRFQRKLSITSVRGGGGELPPLSGFACATSNSTAAPSPSHDSAVTNNNNYNLHQQQHLESLLLGDLSRSSATSTNFKLLSEKLNSLREFRENIYTDSQMYGEAGDLNLETAIRVASSEIISYLGNHHVAKSEEVDEAGNLIVLSSSSLKLVPVGIHGFQDEIATKREQRIQNDRRRDELQQQLMSYSSQLAALNKEIFNCNDFSSEFERHELKHRLELQKERMACLEAQEFASFYLEEKKREHQLNNEFRSALSRCGDILQRYLDILSFSGTEKDMDEFDRNAKHRREVQSLLENLRAPVTDTESMVPTAVDNFDEYCRFNGELLHQFRITYSTNLRKQQEEDGKRAREHKKRIQKEKLNKLAAEDDECERMDEDRQADIENTLRELRFTNNNNNNNLSQSQSNNNNNENKTNSNDNDENDPLGGTHSALDRARLRKLQKQNQPSSKQTESNNNTAANSNQPNIMISSSSKEFFVTNNNNNNENENENQNTSIVSGGNSLSIQRRKSTAVDVFADDNDNDDDDEDDEEYDDQTPNSKRLPKNIESNSSSTTTPFGANKNNNNSINNNFVNASSPATAKEPIQPPVPFHKRVVIPSHLDVTQKRISTSMSLLGSSSSTPHRRNNNNNSHNDTLNSLSSPSPQQGSGTGSSQAFWGNSTRRSRNALAHQISLKVNHSEGSNNKTTSSISSSAIPSLANTSTTAMASPSATLSLLMQNHLLHHATTTTSGATGGVVSNTSFSSASHHTSSNPGSATKPQRVSSYSQMHLNHLNHHQQNQNQQNQNPPPQQLNTSLLSNSAATTSTANANSNNNNNNQQNPNLNSNSFSSQHNSFAMDEKKNTSEFLLFSSSNQHNDDLSFSSQRENNNNGNGNEQDNHGEELEGDDADDDDTNNNISMGPAEKAAMIRALQANKYSANHFVNPNHQHQQQKSQNNTSSSPRTNNNKSNNTSSPPSSSNTNNFQRQNTASSSSIGNAKKNSFDNNAVKTLSSSPSPPNKHNPSTYQRESSPKATSVLGNNNNNDKSNVSSPASSPRIGSVSTQQQQQRQQQLHVDPQSNNNNNSVLQRSSSSLMGGSTYSTATTNSATENNNNNNVVIPTTPTTASAANNKKQQNTSGKDAIGNSPGLYSNAPLVRKNTSTAVGKAGTTEKDSPSPVRNTKEVVSSVTTTTAQTPKQQSSAKTKINTNNNNNKNLNEKTLEQPEKNNNKVPPPPTLSTNNLNNNNLSTLLATPSKSNQNNISTTTTTATTPTTPTVTASSTRVTSGRVSAAQLKLQQQQQIINNNNNNNATPSSNINNNNTSTISTATTSTTAGVKRVSEIKAALQNAAGDTDKKNTEHPTIIKSSYASIHNTKLHQHSQQPVPPPPPLPSTPKISTSATKAKTTDDSQINNSSSTPTTMSVLATTPFAGRSSKPRENSGENTNNNNTESSQNSSKHNDATPSNNANTKQNNTNKNQLQTDDSNKRSNRLLDKLTRNAPGVLQSVNLLSMSTSATSNNGSTVESNATATTGRGNAMVMTQQQHQKNNFSSSSITNASTSASFSKKQQQPQQKVVVASSVECSAVKQQNEDSVLLEEVDDNDNNKNNHNVVTTPENYNDREFVNQNISALTEQLQQHEEYDNKNDNNGFEENEDDDDDDENNIHNIVRDENSGSPILNETKLGTLEQNQSQDNNNNNSNQQQHDEDDDQSETSPELLRPNVLLFEGSGDVDEDAGNDEL